MATVRIPGDPDSEIARLSQCRGIVSIDVKGVRVGAKAEEKSVKTEKPKRKKRELKNPIPLAMNLQINLYVPVLVVSEANQREHWAVKNRRKKEQQAAIASALAGCKLPQSMAVTRGFINFRRLNGSARQMDSDNLAGACKGCRDQIAKWLEIDDGDKRLEWTYEQVSGGPQSGILVQIMVDMGER